MPRSPSRDLADRYTGNRGYFRRPDAVRRAKVWCALVALGLSGGWVVLDATNPPRAAYSHSHGPLTNPHAPWDDNCQACHKPQAFDPSAPLSVFKARDRWHDLTCEKCHAGPAHHAAVTADGAAFHNQCSNCHHDHGGRGKSLTRIDDSHCTRCHANLDAHHAGGKDASAFEKTVAAFDAHPEFGLLRQHPPSGPGPRGLKFSHSLHMTPGLVYKRDGGVLTPKTLKAQFGDAATPYLTPGQPDDAPLQMTCAMCHPLDAGRPSPTLANDPAAKPFDVLRAALKDQPLNAVLPPRAEGAYYLPVNFDAHCKTCHPLNPPGAAFSLPHRKQPAELRHLVSAEHSRKWVHDTNPAQTGPRLDPRTPAEVATLRREIDSRTNATMSQLLAGLTPLRPESLLAKLPAAPKDQPLASACGKCHVADDRSKPDAPLIAPAGTRVVWFPHATFNHATHRGTACSECHPGTESRVSASGETEGTEFEPIRIRGVKSCQQCHAPAGRKVELASGEVVPGGGVRHNCTDCHRYHNGDHALSGRGAPARDPLRPRTLEEFLRGK